MPVRVKAIAVLDTFEGVSPEDTYVALIESIDWNRVKFESKGRCLALHSDQIPDDSDLGCGACIEAVMLATETYPIWKKED